MLQRERTSNKLFPTEERHDLGSDQKADMNTQIMVWWKRHGETAVV